VIDWQESHLVKVTKMVHKLLIATRNPGKAREYQEILAECRCSSGAGLPLKATYLDVEGITLEVEESGASFAENAVQKAVAYAGASGMWTWADDSGLEVDALNGGPGIHSARYAGPEASDADRRRKLLNALAGVPWKQRTARFRCVIALAIPYGKVRTAEGTCEGVIAFGPAGDNGFGYDPVFYLPDHGATMAQLPSEEKNRISHRGRAARAAGQLLVGMLKAQPLG
jgi:XTP/dITP diphosphohydrolase